MVKKIIIISSNFYPDIGPGAFRTTLMAEELLKFRNCEVTVITQEPNRYENVPYNKDKLYKNNFFKTCNVIRYKKINFFYFDKSRYLNYLIFFFKVLLSNKTKDCDIIWTTSSRFFTMLLAFLCKRKNTNLYIDIRDLFIDNISEIYFKKKFTFIFKILKFFEKLIYKKSKINLISPGFNNYLDNYNVTYTSFYHGISDIFYNYYKNNKKERLWYNKSNKILYVGNLGEGQGIHILLPELAKINSNLKITIIGDGKYKSFLEKKIQREKIKNIILIAPMEQKKLLSYYENTDFLLINLNDYSVFNNVIPSKIFEYSVFNKPILSGTVGVSKELLSTKIDKSFFFKPNNSIELNKLILNLSNKSLEIDRDNFVEDYNYRSIIKKYALKIYNNE